MQLSQGNMSIAEYTWNFKYLCHFSKICQGDPDSFEEWKCLKYKGGLRDELIHSLKPLELQNFVELVNKNQLMEDCEKKMAATRMGRQNLP
ncbi:hypothetical protein AHAS_Ahas19G0119800 [Arachis hypogaea]